MITMGTVVTPWGRLAIEVREFGLRAVHFDGPDGPALGGPWAEAFTAYLAKQPFPLDLPVDLSGVPAFSRRVLEACRQIPFGAVTTYAELAKELGCPRGARAVGQALARNPVPLVIPCHRVVGASGQLTGFAGGLDWKRNLLLHEKSRNAE